MGKSNSLIKDLQSYTLLPEEGEYIYNLIKNKANDPEAVKQILNSEFLKLLDKKGFNTSNPGFTAFISDKFLHQLLGEAALREIPGLSNMRVLEAIKTANETSQPGLQNIFEKLGFDRKIQMMDSGDYKKINSWLGSSSYDPRRGIYINPVFESPELIENIRQALGTGFHENAHSADTIRKHLAALFGILNKNPIQHNSEVDAIHGMIAREQLKKDPLLFDKIIPYIEEYERSNPAGTEDPKFKIFDKKNYPEIMQYTAALSPNPRKFINKKNLTPMELQSIYGESGHFFKRNFAFESLMNALKYGVKGIRSVAPIVAPALKYGGTAGKVAGSALAAAGAAGAFQEAKAAGLGKAAEGKIKKVSAEILKKNPSLGLLVSTMLPENIEDSVNAMYGAIDLINPTPITPIEAVKGYESNMEKQANLKRESREEMYKPEWVKNIENSQSRKDREAAKLKEQDDKIKEGISNIKKFLGNR